MLTIDRGDYYQCGSMVPKGSFDAGGVGVNYAIQVAVAGANQIAAKLCDGRLELEDLEQVQKRRYWPVALMQALQVQQAKQLAPLTDGARDDGRTLRVLAFAAAFPPLKRILGRLVGLGFRRDHIRSPTSTYG